MSIYAEVEKLVKEMKEMPYPNKANIIKQLKETDVFFKGTRKDFDVLEQTFKAEEEEVFRQVKRLYRQKQYEFTKQIEALAQNELESVLGLEARSERSKQIHALVWNKAYEDGHASGYSEVILHYMEMLELLQKIASKE